VRDEDQAASLVEEAANAGDALLLKSRIPHGQGFVNEEDVGAHCRCDAEGESQSHPTRIGADRLFQVIRQLGERGDLWQQLCDLS
jgi:hypothetical protein